MKQTHIAYLCTEDSPFIAKALSSRYSVQVYRAGTDGETKEDQPCDIVIFQDAGVWKDQYFRKWKNCPWLFVSNYPDIRGYIAPTPNLSGVLNLGGASLETWGVPDEFQLRLEHPVEQIADYYFYEQQPETCRIVYCPTANSIRENDLKLLSFVQGTNATLTIISDEYQAIKSAFPASVKILPRKSIRSAFKKAHLVIASGHNAICAMAVCKPCIILGDYGLGGLVTPANYEQLQSVSFRGRKGACLGEMVPRDLLEAEICKVFFADYKESLLTIQEKIKGKYSLKSFSERLFSEIDQIIDLFVSMKSKKKRLLLKPYVSSVFRIEESEGKRYMMRGMICFGELEEEMSGLLKQCDGATPIQELIEKNQYDPEDAAILWENLYALWKEKLILFKP